MSLRRRGISYLASPFLTAAELLRSGITFLTSPVSFNLPNCTAVCCASWTLPIARLAVLGSVSVIVSVHLVGAVVAMKQLYAGEASDGASKSATTSMSAFFISYWDHKEILRPWTWSDSIGRGSPTNLQSLPSYSLSPVWTNVSDNSGHPPRILRIAEYDWSKSTEENYRLEEFCDGKDNGTPAAYESPFAEIRKSLDRSFHAEYSPERQRFQDYLIQMLLQQQQQVEEQKSLPLRTNEDQCSPRSGLTSFQPCANELLTSKCAPWVVFSAGAMGAGKTWTVKLLHEKGRFPLDEFVMVDPDAIRHYLPEFETYIKLCPERAGELTRMECGMVAEILVKAALDQRRNVLVDGSLRNASWYINYFAQLRRDYQGIKIAILHVTAPRHVILSRASRRSKETGRVVPADLLERVISEVPTSYELLRPHVDLAVEIRNDRDEADDVELVHPATGWRAFQQRWGQ